MLTAAIAAALVGFFTLPPARDDPDAKPVPVTIAPRTGGGLWIVLPDSGGGARAVPAHLRKLRPGPAALKKALPAMKGKLGFRAVSDATSGTLVLEDGVLVRATLGAGKCTTGALIRDPSTAPTTSGGFTRADFLIVETDPGFGCDEPAPKSWKGHGLQGGLRVTFDTAGRPVGAQL